MKFIIRNYKLFSILILFVGCGYFVERGFVLKSDSVEVVEDLWKKWVFNLIFIVIVYKKLLIIFYINKI